MALKQIGHFPSYWAEASAFKKHIQIFINRYDVVPRLSMYTLAKFYEAATIIDQRNLMGKDFSIPGW